MEAAEKRVSRLSNEIQWSERTFGNSATSHTSRTECSKHTRTPAAQPVSVTWHGNVTESPPGGSQHEKPHLVHQIPSKNLKSLGKNHLQRQSLVSEIWDHFLSILFVPITGTYISSFNPSWAGRLPWAQPEKPWCDRPFWSEFGPFAKRVWSEESCENDSTILKLSGWEWEELTRTDVQSLYWNL